MPSLAPKWGSAPSFLGDAFLILWDKTRMYAFPLIPLIYRVLRKVRDGKAKIVFNHPSMAQADLVPLPAVHVSLPSTNSLDEVRPPIPGQWSAPPSTTGEAPPESVAPPWFQVHELTCSEQVKHILLNSRQDSTHNTYLQKWKCFSI